MYKPSLHPTNMHNQAFSPAVVMHSCVCCSSGSGYVLLVAGQFMVQPDLSTVSDQCVSAQQVQCSVCVCCNYKHVALRICMIVM